MKRDYYRVDQYGPGGISCACCNPYRCHTRHMKQLSRRKVRRLGKIDLRKEY